MDLHLEDKVALITGGSSGIGLAIARALAREKVNVILCTRHEKRAAEEADNIARTFAVRSMGFGVDVTDPAGIGRLVESVQSAFSGIDILINNAGEGTDEMIMDAPDEKWQYYWDLHVMAAVRLARGFVPGMRRRGGGVILNNASICARQPLPHEPIYNVTKAALSMLSKCLANELIGDNIRVNCINPGLVLTRGWTDHAREVARSGHIDPEAYLKSIAREKTPIGRFATVDELASFFVFLCSPHAGYCVGSTYYVDGGWLNVVT